MKKPQPSKPSYIIDKLQTRNLSATAEPNICCEDGVSTFLRNVRKIIILHSVRTTKNLISDNNIFGVNNITYISFSLPFFFFRICVFLSANIYLHRDMFHNELLSLFMV